MISGSREKELIEAANMLLDARRTHTPIADLPARTAAHLARRSRPRPRRNGRRLRATSAAGRSARQACRSHALLRPDAARLDGRQRRTPDRPDFPLSRPRRRRSRSSSAKTCRPRAQPYTREEVVAAIASCHPVDRRAGVRPHRSQGRQQVLRARRPADAWRLHLRPRLRRLALASTSPRRPSPSPSTAPSASSAPAPTPPAT